MQLLPPLTRDPKVMAREAPAGRHLPYARHLDRNTIETRDGMLMQTIRIGGLLFETADSEELNYRSELRDAMLRAIGNSRFAIYHHIVRRRADAAMTGDFPDAFSERLDQRWRERLSRRQLYVNELFLTLVRRPTQGRMGFTDRLKSLFASATDNRAALLAAEKHSLDNAREALVAALGQYDPHVLSTYESEDGTRSEPIEFLAYLFNGEMRPAVVPHGDIGHHLPVRRASFGLNTVELAPAGHLDRRFVAVVSIKDWPQATMPGMFDELTRLPFELTMSQSFAFVERGAALGRMNLALRRMKSAEDEALSLREELTLAKDEVAAGRAGFGEHHSTIAVHGDSLADLDRHVAEVIALLADLGIAAVREDIALEPAFWAQFPGNFRYIGRRGLVSTTNFEGFASLHNFPVGNPRAITGERLSPCSRPRWPAPTSSIFTRMIWAISRSSARPARARRWYSISCSRRRANIGRARFSSIRIVVRSCSSGRSAALTTDCAPKRLPVPIRSSSRIRRKPGCS